ncbi:MAG: hypothetical protein JRG91_05760 [Deltaproteobacteria bacterium]|nr:hypothetical protein [Deltaproteobacteria bacterium]
MEATRLARACALVSGAMGRNPGALADVTAGEVSRAMVQASGLDVAGARDLLEPTSVEGVHATWYCEPLSRLHPECRAPLLGLLPGPVARFAALALERATGETVEDAPAARGMTAASLAASLRPPLGHAPPGFLDRRGAQDPLVWVSRNVDALPCELVFTGWPGEARELEAALGAVSEQAGALVTLAACLAARADDARAIAARMPFSVGTAFLAARSRWVLALDTGEAADLYARIADTKGDGTS